MCATGVGEMCSICVNVSLVSIMLSFKDHWSVRIKGKRLIHNQDCMILSDSCKKYTQTGSVL